MRRVNQALLGACIAALAAGVGQAQQIDPRPAKALAMEFQDRLRSQLVDALKNGGPLLALDICQKAAPAIAADITSRTGAKIWRVSLAARNPKGTPDAWERATLEQFAARRAAGEDPATLEAVTSTSTGLRFMKAIPMAAEPCQTCHGTHIAPEVAAKIAALYPNDRATGFAPGALRGAVSVTIPPAR